MCRPQIVEASSTDFQPVPADVVKTKKEKKSVKSNSKKGKDQKPDNQDKVLAERFRTKRCKNFIEKGKCPYESRCMFAHGDRELRTTEQNLHDGLVTEEAIRQFKKMMTLKLRAQAAEHHHRQQQQQRMTGDKHSESGSIESFGMSTSAMSEENSLLTYTCHNGETSYVHNPYGFKAVVEEPSTPPALDIVGVPLFIRRKKGGAETLVLSC